MRTRMNDQATMQQLIERPAQGLSDRAIARQLQVAMGTRPPPFPSIAVPRETRGTRSSEVPKRAHQNERRTRFVQFLMPRTDSHTDFGPISDRFCARRAGMDGLGLDNPCARLRAETPPGTLHLCACIG
jgi:hypothetical protein